MWLNVVESPSGGIGGELVPWSSRIHQILSSTMLYFRLVCGGVRPGILDLLLLIISALLLLLFRLLSRAASVIDWSLLLEDVLELIKIVIDVSPDVVSDLLANS